MSADHDPCPGFTEGSPEAGFTWARADGSKARLDVPDAEAGELADLVGLRDATRALLDAEAGGTSTAGVEALRAELGQRHDAYVARHGPAGRGSPQGRPAQGGFRADPYAPLVYALEHRDPATGEVARSEVFTRRVVTEAGQPGGLHTRLGPPAVPSAGRGEAEAGMEAGV
ncbi:MAG TPA: hypothetical protein VGM53_14690 [Streptosporangiaceae bacterium]|jgi:hypothetical protein